MGRDSGIAGGAWDFEASLIALGRWGGAMQRPSLVPSPPLEALRKAGTAHVYADTADVDELRDALGVGEGEILAEVDGNTANQPLVERVTDRVLDAGDAAHWARILREARPALPVERLLPFLYAILCARIGNDLVRAFASRRSWEVSLQLHMGLSQTPQTARWIGQLLRSMVPTAFVKVPFTPHAPDCFLVARDLESRGVPVNFTSTFSARQVVAAALLADVERTNVFMGRLSEGLRAARLGEHVDLEAQRALVRLRRDHGVKTRLIVASLRDWRSLVRTAGCDVYTAPCGVLRDLLEQDEVGPEQIESRLETSYADELGIDVEVERALGPERIGRLWRVEEEFVAFLVGLRGSDAYRDMRDGEALARRFEEAGFGGFFHAPSEAEWRELRAGKLPDPGARLTRALDLDTHFTLRADADFEKHQAAIDARIADRIEAGPRK